MGFLINSKVNPYVQKQPHLLAAQASIDVANHTCLNNNSYVDCNDLYPFEDFELQNDCGAISSDCKTKIQEAVSKSKTISRHYKDLIVPPITPQA